MRNKREELDAKVLAVNTANAEANRIYPILRKIFEPFVGQKIEKADGGLLAKIAKLIPEFPYSNRLHVYKNSSDYTLSWTVKTCIPYGGNTCTYWETGVYVADLRSGVLEKLYPEDRSWKTDYNADDVEKKREVYKKAKEVADNAFSDLYPFGE